MSTGPYVCGCGRSFQRPQDLTRHQATCPAIGIRCRCGHRLADHGPSGARMCLVDSGDDFCPCASFVEELHVIPGGLS